MLLTKDPRSYLYHVVAYVQATDPRATTEDQLIRLFEGLSTHFKKHFIRDKPTAINEFTERLKDVRRKQLYEQKSLLQQVSAGIGPASTTLFSALAATSANSARSTEQATLEALLALN